MKIGWVLGVFERSGQGFLIEEHPTTGVDPVFLRRIWHLTDDDPAIGLDFPVTPENVAEVQKHVDVKLDLERFHYALHDTTDEFDAEPPP